MIKKQEFHEGQKFYYSDFGIKSYVIIEAVNIYRTNGKHFWFYAKIVDNYHVDNKKFFEVGSVKSFSNSFIFKSYDDMVQGVESYKDQLTAYVRGLTARRP
jgi:hypothetical protein